MFRYVYVYVHVYVNVNVYVYVHQYMSMYLSIVYVYVSADVDVNVYVYLYAYVLFFFHGFRHSLVFEIFVCVEGTSPSVLSVSCALTRVHSLVISEPRNPAPQTQNFNNSKPKTLSPTPNPKNKA